MTEDSVLEVKQSELIVTNSSPSATLLCVDDEANILQSLKRLLRREGYTILTAESGEEGLACLASNPQVQIVISDQRMPGMSGSQFLMQVKKNYPDMIRVILSGYAEAEAIVEAINDAEVYHFLPKPWNDEELKALLRQCLAYYALRMENQRLLQKTQEQNDELQRLNNQLAERVDLQAQSLYFSQDILDKLPIPVIGISQDGMIVLTNEAARLSPVLHHLFIGENMTDILPKPLSGSITRIIKDALPFHHVDSWIFGEKSIKVHLTPILSEEQCRGCILLMEEWS